MTTSVIIALPIASGPTRQVEIRLPIVDNRVCCFVNSDSKSIRNTYLLAEFIGCLEHQARAMTLIEDASNSVIDCHIGGLMASIMSYISAKNQITMAIIEMYMDCFCYMLYADGFAKEDIVKMRPSIIQTIKELCPSIMKD